MPSGHRPQPPVGTARVAISGLTPGSQNWVNVFWLNITATTHVAADLKSIIDTMVTAYGTRFGPTFSSQGLINAVHASWLYASNTVLEYNGSYSIAGSAGSSNATDAVCAMVNWAITDYYRGGHPRTYLPPLASTSVQNADFVSSSMQTTINTAAAGFLSDVNAETHGGISAVALGTVRFASGNAWLSPPVFRAYQSGACRPRIAIQKRRLGGR